MSRVEKSMNTLRSAFKANSDYADSWHCNLACIAMDAGADHKTANDGASRFMRLAFDVETGQKYTTRPLR